MENFSIIESLHENLQARKVRRALGSAARKLRRRLRPEAAEGEAQVSVLQVVPGKTWFNRLQSAAC